MSAAQTDCSDVFLVVDGEGQRRNAKLVCDLGLRQVSVDALSAEDANASDFMAVDVDVTQPRNIALLRKAFVGRRHGYVKVFAIDTSSRLAIVHANVLGATEAVRRPFNANDLAARIKRHRERDRYRENEAAVASIGTAAEIIGDMLDALRDGQAFKVDLVFDVGEQIVDAIAQAGLPTWVDVVRKHHEGTFQHCLIVTGVAASFARSIGMSRSDIATVTNTALLHDIGKAATPIRILDKAGSLTAAEFEIIRQHPGRGYSFLKQNAMLAPDILDAVRGHHEYLDGSGYPDGLRSGEIGDLTRILTISDIYGALIEQRAYKPALGRDAALEIVDDMASNGKLDRALVRAFNAAV